MANLNNVSLRLNGFDIDLMKLNGSIVYQKNQLRPEDFYVEYTVQQVPVALDAEYDTYMPLAMPIIRNTSSSGHGSYEAIEITLNDGSITTDTSTLCENIAKVKLWYPVDTIYLRFGGYNDSYETYFSSIGYCNTSKMEDINNFVTYCTGLTSVDGSNWNTSNATRMDGMFYNCKQLTSLDVSSFDTSNVTSMGSMFQNCESLTSLDVSNFDTRNVTYMRGMFQGCKSLTSLDVSNWDTSNVTNMGDMFWNCANLTKLDLSNWNTSNVTNMFWMFMNCTNLALLNISNFDISNVPDDNMWWMFNGCDKLHTLRLDNCSRNTIEKILTLSDLPSSPVEDGPNGQNRIIYAKRAECFGLSSLLPDYWSFAFID